MERRTASPARFYPTGLDCRSWARAARQGGINCAIPAAKRRDGFCLWPTRAAEYSVKSNPWKRRTVRELQPGAVAAQTGDPDIRWGGNEAGCVHPDPRTVVDEERWATAWEIEPTRLRKGGAYLPVEMDTTINRAGWFWHPGSEEKINYLDQHLGVYLQGMRQERFDPHHHRDGPAIRRFVERGGAH